MKFHEALASEHLKANHLERKEKAVMQERKVERKFSTLVSHHSTPSQIHRIQTFLKSYSFLSEPGCKKLLPFQNIVL